MRITRHLDVQYEHLAETSGILCLGHQPAHLNFFSMVDQVFSEEQRKEMEGVVQRLIKEATKPAEGDEPGECIPTQ